MRRLRQPLSPAGDSFSVPQGVSVLQAFAITRTQARFTLRQRTPVCGGSACFIGKAKGFLMEYQPQYQLAVVARDSRNSASRITPSTTSRPQTCRHISPSREDITDAPAALE